MFGMDRCSRGQACLVLALDSLPLVPPCSPAVDKAGYLGSAQRPHGLTPSGYPGLGLWQEN